VKRALGIFAFILLLAFKTYGQQHNESVLNIPVTISMSNSPLSDVLGEISKNTNVYFSYDASAVVSDRPVTISVNNQPMINVLYSLFDASAFSFIGKENQIVISLLEEDTSKTGVRDAEDSLFITLSGRLVNDARQNPIPYAYISVDNLPIGTVANDNGEFVLKIKHTLKDSLIAFSCLGYAQKKLPVNEVLNNKTIKMHPVSILIKEIRVKAISPEEIMDRVIERLPGNYSNELTMMNAFYRETLMQDGKYINISEAVVDILKPQYSCITDEDKVRIVKGRKSPDVRPFQWINFKLMGGLHSISLLDVVKTMDTFLDPEYRPLYKYSIDKVIWFHDHPVFVVEFRPINNTSSLCYEGEMYIDRETFAVLHVDFGFSKQGLRIAEQSLIKKKPRGYTVRPLKVDYSVDYRYNDGLCFFNAAKATMEFKVKNRTEDINSQFTSVSEILVTDFKKSQVKRFPRNQVSNETDIFTENITNFDEEFWGNFNFLKPDEDLQSAIEKLKTINQSIGRDSSENVLLTHTPRKK
jgi:hypothetical protein